MEIKASSFYDKRLFSNWRLNGRKEKKRNFFLVSIIFFLVVKIPEQIEESKEGSARRLRFNVSNVIF